MLRCGDVIVATIQFVDTFEVKTRPAVVLFEEFGNVVVAGITSNVEMRGIPLTKAEGAMVDSVIRVNYVFTIATNMVKKHVFSLSSKKRSMLIDEFVRRLSV